MGFIGAGGGGGGGERGGWALSMSNLVSSFFTASLIVLVTCFWGPLMIEGSRSSLATSGSCALPARM